MPERKPGHYSNRKFKHKHGQVKFVAKCSANRQTKAKGYIRDDLPKGKLCMLETNQWPTVRVRNLALH